MTGSVLLSSSGLLNLFKFTVKLEAVCPLETLEHLTTTQCINPKEDHNLIEQCGSLETYFISMVLSSYFCQKQLKFKTVNSCGWNDVVEWSCQSQMHIDNAVVFVLVNLFCLKRVRDRKVRLIGWHTFLLSLSITIWIEQAYSYFHYFLYLCENAIREVLCLGKI